MSKANQPSCPRREFFYTEGNSNVYVAHAVLLYVYSKQTKQNVISQGATEVHACAQHICLMARLAFSALQSIISLVYYEGDAHVSKEGGNFKGAECPPPPPPPLLNP